MADRFRQAKQPSHVRIYRRQMQSLAWQHLSGSAVKVLLTLAMLERGSNNGELFLSDRKGSEFTGLSRNTVWRALQELMEKGFIYCTMRGGFSRKTPHAACYGLTWEPGPKDSEHRAPSHAYEKWRPDGNTRSQILTETGPIFDRTMETPSGTGSTFGPDEVEKPLVSVTGSLSDIGPHTVSQGIGAADEETDQRKRANPCGRAFLASLRMALAEHLEQAEPGEQTRLANAIGIPGGTLSKFISGRNLPDQHVAALADRIRLPAAIDR